MTELSEKIFNCIKEKHLSRIKLNHLKTYKFKIDGKNQKDLKPLIEEREVLLETKSTDYFFLSEADKFKIIEDVSYMITKELKPKVGSSIVSAVAIEYRDLIPCVDIESEGQYVMISNKTGWVSQMTFKSWKEVTPKEEVDAHLAHKRVCIKRYQPYSLEKFTIKTSDEFGGNYLELNTCVQPDWRYKKESYTLEPLFLDYFNGLFSTNESRQYAIDWCYEAIYGRNSTYLVLCGKKGLGKNILSEAMGYMVGVRNYIEAPRSAITKEFNTYLKEKRLVLLDEVSFREPAEKDKLKSYLNNYQSVEGKGLDAEYVELFCSIILSSNNAKDMNIEPDDRRFSVMDLTDTPLLEKLGEDNIEKLLEYIRSENFPLAFNEFLYRNKSKIYNPNRPFKGKTFKELCVTSINVWQNAIYEAVASKAKDRYSIKDIVTVENRNYFPKRHKDYVTFLQNFTVDGEVIGYYDRGMNIMDSEIIPHDRFKANLKSDL